MCEGPAPQAPSPGDAPPEGRKSRKVCWLWGISLALLLTAGLFSWLVVVPVGRARAAVLDCHLYAYEDEMDTRRYILDRIERIGGKEKAARRLALYLRLPGQDLNHRRMAVEMLGVCGPCALPHLAKLVSDEDRWVRYAAVNELDDLRDPRAFEPLLIALDDPEEKVRTVAAWAIGGIGGPRAVAPLIALLKDPAEPVRWSAAHRLGDLGDHRAVKPLAETLKHAHPRTRWAAACSLAKLGDSRAFGPLATALLGKGPDWQPPAAARLLGVLGDPRAVGPLTQALSDGDPDVRQAVAEALKKIRAAGKKEEPPRGPAPAGAQKKETP